MRLVAGQLQTRNPSTSRFIHQKGSSRVVDHTARCSRSVNQRRRQSIVAQRIDNSAFGALNRRCVLNSIAIGCIFAPTPKTGAAIVDEEVAERVFTATAPSIVSIFNFKNVDGEDVAEGTGSGIVWDSRGHIVTNYHCISRLARDSTRSQKTIVGLTGGSGTVLELPSQIVGLDPDHDLAVLLVDAPEGALQPIKVGTSSTLKVGQSVYALGNPYGLQKTMTAGLVSGLNRTLPSPGNTKIVGVIQTDASINRGSSGGALLDSGGRLVGLSTATFTRLNSARSSGVNFALPVDLLYQVVPNLIVYGSPSGRAASVRLRSNDPFGRSKSPAESMECTPRLLSTNSARC